MAAPKGNRNNPNGRPPKNRALTEILAKAGSKGRGKHVIAKLLWQAATTGSVAFDGDSGRVLALSNDEWFGVVKFIYQQIDGAPKQQTEVTGANGGALQTEIVIRYSDAVSVANEDRP